jgi:hypothetical protein
MSNGKSIFWINMCVNPNFCNTVVMQNFVKSEIDEQRLGNTAMCNHNLNS